MHKQPFALLACLALPALAQTAPPPAPATDVLRGPEMKTHAPTEGAAPTLVRKSFEGKLERLDTRPEYAAIELMHFDEAHKTALDKVIAEHNTLVNQTLFAHLDLLLQIQNANQAGDRAGALPLARKLREQAPDLFEPPLMDRLAAEMTPEDARTFKGMLREYAQAFQAEQRESAKGQSPDMQRADAPPANPDAPIPNVRRYDTQLTIREMARALGATVAERKERLDRMLKAIDATPEIETQIRAIIRTAAAENKGGQLTQDQRAATTRTIFDLLTPEQRRQWLQAATQR